MRTLDDLITQCLGLLHRAGLANAEVILSLSRNTLVQRLTDAGRGVQISPGVTLEMLIQRIRTAAESKGAGELTSADLREIWQDPPVGSASRGLPGNDDFPVWGRDRDQDLDQAGLPGEDDFPPWGDRGGDEPER